MRIRHGLCWRVGFGQWQGPPFPSKQNPSLLGYWPVAGERGLDFMRGLRKRRASYMSVSQLQESRPHSQDPRTLGLDGQSPG